MKAKLDGHFSALRQKAQNTLDANAFDIIGGLLSGTALSEYSESIRLLDASDVEIATRTASWSYTSDASSVEVEGSATFSQADMTADAAKAQLVSNLDRVMAEATFGAPLSSGQAVVVTRIDTITAV